MSSFKRGKPAAPPSVASAPYAQAFAPIQQFDSSPRPMFPEIPLPPAIAEFPLSTENESLYEMHKLLVSKMKRSPYFCRKSKEESGDKIERYSDRFASDEDPTIFSTSDREMFLKKVVDMESLPVNLQLIFQRKANILLRRQKSFDEKSIFEKMSRREGVNPGAAEDDIEQEEEEEPLEDDEDDNDYNANYFDPGDEYLDVDGGEDDGDTF